MTEKLKNYWFYLEPYTFVFKSEDEIVLYNTLNAAYIVCPSNAVDLIERLLDDKNYCVKISDSDLDDRELLDFINTVRESFSGDYVPYNETVGKPFIFKPTLRLNDNYHKIRLENEDIEGHNVLYYLNELSFHLTDSCGLQCPHCSEYSKQFSFCRKRESSCDFPVKELIKILDHVDQSEVGRVNFLGGNIFEYKYIQELISVLLKYKFKKHFLVHINHLDEQTVAFIHDLSEKKCSFCIFVTPELLNENLKYCIENSNVEYVLIVDSEDSLLKAINLMSAHPLLKIEIHPFFNGVNMDFFRENVFMDLEDLLSSPISKKSIFRHQTLNENFFGKMSVMPDGETYSNLNYDSLGNVFGNVLSINKLVYDEMKNGKAWFKLRDTPPCQNCCNKYLCPSPSNYEIVMGKSNLCNIKE